MDKKKSIIALLLLIPAPSIGVVCGMYLYPDTVFGKSVYLSSKVWLFAFPVLWLLLVEKGRVCLSPVKKGGLLTGLLTGIGISLMILIVYIFLGNKLINISFFAEKIKDIGLGNKYLYLGCALYWILVNSVLEEYVWRWFVAEKAENLLPKSGAIILSALGFTLHHILALAILVNISGVIFFSLGVFAGGAIWSFMYLKFRSIWPCYLSHAIVDLCIFSIGWTMLS